MKKNSGLVHIIIRNLIGLAALLGIHFISDRNAFFQRDGLQQISPYFFLLGMYAWIVFHNRVLFEKLYLKRKKQQYLLITLLVMGFSSLNMHLILVYGFDVENTLSMILSYWVYTLAGLGVFVMFNYLKMEKDIPDSALAVSENRITHFECMVDGEKQNIPLENILYIESLENYIKVITTKSTMIVRLSLKEAEERLPKSTFIRISRSHIINKAHSTSIDQENIKIRDQQLKIGKVYKRYVSEHL